MRSTSSERLSLCHQPIKLDKLNAISVLELVDASISESECLLIAKNQNMKELKTLNLACNPIGGKGLSNLLMSKSLGKLEILVIYDCRIKGVDVFDFCMIP